MSKLYLTFQPEGYHCRIFWVFFVFFLFSFFLKKLKIIKHIDKYNIENLSQSLSDLIFVLQIQKFIPKLFANFTFIVFNVC